EAVVRGRMDAISSAVSSTTAIVARTKNRAGIKRTATMESITTNGLTRASSRNEERWTRLRATNTREPALSSHSRVGIRKKAAGWLEALSGTNATSEPIAST